MAPLPLIFEWKNTAINTVETARAVPTQYICVTIRKYADFSDYDALYLWGMLIFCADNIVHSQIQSKAACMGEENPVSLLIFKI